MPACVAPTTPDYISEDELWDQYKIVPTAAGDSVREFAAVKGEPVEHVWSLVDGEEDDGIYASPGFHVVNVFGYILTEKPWTDITRDAIYMQPLS